MVEKMAVVGGGGGGGGRVYVAFNGRGLLKSICTQYKLTLMPAY